jgi:hypothetical protein
MGRSMAVLMESVAISFAEMKIWVPSIDQPQSLTV